MFWFSYKFWDFILLQLKMENYALKARIVAAERLDVLHKESCKSSNVLHKILSAFSFFKWMGSVPSVRWLKWRLNWHFMVLSHTQSINIYRKCIAEFINFTAIGMTRWLWPSDLLYSLKLRKHRQCQYRNKNFKKKITGTM